MTHSQNIISDLKEEIVDSEKVGVALNYVSADGEEGYPSICDVTVQYLLYLDENIMEITYFATTDHQTVVNLTRNVEPECVLYENTITFVEHGIFQFLTVKPRKSRAFPLVPPRIMTRCSCLVVQSCILEFER